LDLHQTGKEGCEVGAHFFPNTRREKLLHEGPALVRAGTVFPRGDLLSGLAAGDTLLDATRRITGDLMDHSFIYRDIAMVFAGAFICGLLAWRLKQPILLGYVLAGLILSPLTPGPHVHHLGTFETIAEIGVILLMFSVGMEFSMPELLKVKWVALLGAPLGILISVGIATGIGLLLGWPLLQGIALGCIISVASTMVMIRLLMDRGELSAESGRVMITLTLVEDLAVVILTILLPSLNSGQGGFAQVVWKIGRALLLLVPICLAGWKIVPRLLARVEKTCNDEISLLLALTICMVVAALLELIGLSLALGAFVAGLLLGNSDFVYKLEKQTRPLRDAFVALFFVTVGMLIDPNTWVSSWHQVLLLVAVIIVGKFVVWSGVVRMFGYNWDTARRVGIGLTQIGEFSFILAQASLNSGLISREIYNATLVASLVTILANATFFKFLSPAPASAQARAG
jgi:monovalent cation:H+ antiporter-2, CPA2 family